MAHTVDRHYADLGGMDTRSNKLLQNSRTQRNGSKNYRYDFEDNYTKANGAQHRFPMANVVDLLEYKFRDVNTGQSKREILSVQTDGRLYKIATHTLKFLTHGAATSYSFYYDELTDNFTFSMNGLGQISVTTTTTMEQLRVALNALTGVSVEIRDQFGDVTTSSTKLAYLMKCVIENNFETNDSMFWTVVPFPDMTCTTTTQKTEKTVDYLTDYTWASVPFPTTVKAQNAVTYPDVAANYEGISFTNLNNSIYITDGGFLMKYDGKVVYRAGVPHLNYETPSVPEYTDVYRLFNASNILGSNANSADTGDLPQGNYWWTFRLGFTDYSGATNYGTINQITNPLAILPGTPSGPYQYAPITIGGMQNGGDFPVFAAVINGDQGNGTGAGITLSVDAGHNILPGMVIRQEVKTSTATGYQTKSTTIGFLAKVVSVNNTGIVLQSIACTAGDLAYIGTFYNDWIVNGYYTQEFYESKVPGRYLNPPGFFVEIYRTKINQTAPFYLAYRGVMPRKPTDTVLYHENKGDNSMYENQADADLGEELPRAGKYITSWQNCLTQAGLPPDGTLANARYPTAKTLSATAYCQTTVSTQDIYTEAMLCDYQSIYYADPLTSEGFPLDGVHEFAIDSQFSDQIKGIAQNKDSLFAMKERSTGILSGDLGTNDLTLEILEDDIGCVSHKTIQDVYGSLIWLDKDKGFYSCVAGRLPVHVGYPICDYQQNNFQKLDYSKATAANFRSLDLYICAVGTTWFVLDYSETETSKRFCWYDWQRFNAKSLLNTSLDEHLIVGIDGQGWQIKDTKTKYDYTDHKSAIEMLIKSSWLNYGAPTIDKAWERVWVNSIQGLFKLVVEFYGNYREDIIGSQSFDFGNETRLTVKEQVKCALPKLSALSVGFKNAEKNQLVKIQGWEVEYEASFDPGEPKR